MPATSSRSSGDGPSPSCSRTVRQYSRYCRIASAAVALRDVGPYEHAVRALAQRVGRDRGQGDVDRLAEPGLARSPARPAARARARAAGAAARARPGPSRRTSPAGGRRASCELSHAHLACSGCSSSAAGERDHLRARRRPRARQPDVARRGLDDRLPRAARRRQSAVRRFAYERSSLESSHSVPATWMRSSGRSCSAR